VKRQAKGENVLHAAGVRRVQGRVAGDGGRTGADGPPKDLRDRAGIKGGDKLAVIGWEKEGRCAASR